MSVLGELCGVEEVALFGSFAAGQAAARSDVDLLVRFRRPPGLAFVELAERLEPFCAAKCTSSPARLCFVRWTCPGIKIAMAIQEAQVYA